MVCLDAVNSDPKALVVSAFLAVLVGALGWAGKLAVEGFLWSYRRRSREIEIMAALLAEIGSNIAAYRIFSSDETARKLAAEIRDQPNYKIYIPIYKDLFVFDHIKAEITILPEGAIDAVVGFYSESGALDALSVSVQEERFEAFPAERRAHYVDYLRAQAEIVTRKAEAATRELNLQTATAKGGRLRLTVGFAALCTGALVAAFLCLRWAWVACAAAG